MSDDCGFCSYYVQHHNSQCCCRYCYAERAKRIDTSTIPAPVGSSSFTAHDCPHTQHSHRCQQCLLPPYRRGQNPAQSPRQREATRVAGRVKAPTYEVTASRTDATTVSDRSHHAHQRQCDCAISCPCRKLVRPVTYPRRSVTFDPVDVPKMGPEAARYMIEVPRPGRDPRSDARLRFLY